MNKMDATIAVPVEKLPTEGSSAEAPYLMLLWDPQVAQFKKRDKRTLANLVKKLLDLRNQGDLTDEEFAKIIAYVCSVYVESEFEKHFRKVFGRQRSMFLSLSE
jgi:hypothetical protein